MKLYSLIFIAIILGSSCKEVAPPEPVLPLPSERQLAWHELEFYAFVHFSMNTFSDMEWGFGDEKPSLFNPTELDCRQWAKVCKEAGMKGIIITAKHHDGFCLWPSAYTEHSVKNSPWKDGKGDVVQELADACREYGLKMGIYLSPWDRNHAAYGKPEYLNYFRNQLKELLTNYGDIFEVWFDGANGGTGYYGGANEERKIDNRTYYDWENTWKIVRELQPNAVMFSDGGPDVRWIGTEEGWARPTNWSLLKRDEFAPGIIPDIESLRQGQEDGTHWLPAEVDVSIRPGWFYHPSEDHKVKTLPHLLDIYYNSIGRNSSLLINFPVDTRGLIHEKDVEQIQKLAAAIQADFAENLASGAKAKASNVRGNSNVFSANNVLDGNPDTYWCTDDKVVSAFMDINFKDETEVNRFLIQEDIRLGQRVKKFRLLAKVNDDWVTLANETTIGRKRILRFPNVKTKTLKLSILDSKASPVISNIEVYKAPKVLVEPVFQRNKAGMVNIKAFDNGLTIYYTTDGTVPTVRSTKYTEAFLLPGKANVQAIVVDPGTRKSSEISSVKFDISKSKWKVSGVNQSLEDIEKIVDGDPQTAWTAELTSNNELIIDLGEKVQLKGFTYMPEQARANAGIISHYKFYTSTDGKNWGKPLSEGEFSNIRNSPILQTKTFDVTAAMFIKLKSLKAVYADKIGIAEFDVITE